MSEKLTRVDMYLQRNIADQYVNTEEENELVDKFAELYSLALSAQQNTEEANPKNLAKWRKAYYGTLNALTKDGEESTRKGRSLRKMVYELIESKIDNSIPMPKIRPRYKTDLPLVSVTENYLKFEVDGIFTKYLNDRSERSTYVDGTSWYKVWWDSLDNTHERSGNVKIDLCRVDQIVPQPGVSDYRQLEYIFERKELSLTRIWDLYHRRIIPTEANTNVIEVISCYYLNSDRVVGLFMYAPHSRQVICNEEDWQIRKLRTCTVCGTVNPTGDTCRNCGSKTFKYENATEEILENDIEEIYNPYEVGETDDESEKDHYKSRVFLTAGTKIPFYKITQLPFIPRPAISSLDNIYGTSEVKVTLESQDAINKLLTKALEKTMKSGTILTKPEKLKIGDSDDTIKVLSVRTTEEAAMVQSRPVVADTSQDLVMAATLYESGKASSGVTESFQGAKDSSATSGKAKQYAAVMTAGRIESLRVMKSAAFAGLYELVLKYLLAFSDEPRKFVRVLPNGSQKEEVWNKYMFLDKDKYGNIYYRDDLRFDSDPASTLSQNRAQMWQETQDKFVQGAFGNPADPRVLELFWNIMDSLQYPLAKVVLAGIKENSQHLPPEVEQMIMNNPELQALIAQTLQSSGEQRGGARPNSGPVGNGATHASNVERTNERNRSLNREVISSPQSQGVSQ
nr:MAG TPA: Portal protein [Caudoviricetes sp.]